MTIDPRIAITTATVITVRAIANGMSQTVGGVGTRSPFCANWIAHPVLPTPQHVAAPARRTHMVRISLGAERAAHQATISTSAIGALKI
jgi:hypothetical protein